MAATAAPARRYTIDDLAQFPDDGKRRELVDGRIVEWDVTTVEHGFFIMTFGGFLHLFVLKHRLGIVVGGDPYVRMFGSQYHARGPDIAFYARGRIPRDPRAAATDTVPDLVIEILSPSDRAADVQEKVHDWLRAGVKLLWYIDPESGVTAVYQGNHIKYVEADERLDGGDVLPGFTVGVRDVLDEWAALSADDANQDEGGPATE
jgi:Uma2 family endonuclease